MLWIEIRIILLGLVLLIISVEDYQHYRIPWKYCLILGGIGFVDSILMKKNWIECSFGFLSVSLMLMLVYVITKGNGIGGGDIKLMAMSGFLLGWARNMTAFILACMICLIIYPLRKNLLPKRKKLAFAPYLSLGIMLAFLWGDTLIKAYMTWPGL